MTVHMPSGAVAEVALRGSGPVNSDPGAIAGPKTILNEKGGAR